MFKWLCVCYAVVTVTFFSVTISGYWAFGNQADGLILSNFLDDGKALVPKWFILMTNIFTIVQLSAVGVVWTDFQTIWKFSLFFMFSETKTMKISRELIVFVFVQKQFSIVCCFWCFPKSCLGWGTKNLFGELFMENCFHKNMKMILKLCAFWTSRLFFLVPKTRKNEN